MKWGVIGALEQEIGLVVKEMRDVRVTRHYDCNFYTGTIGVGGGSGEVPVTVAECGVGKIRAALAAHILIHEYGVSRIVNTGVAGGVGEGLEACDVVISREVIFHDVDKTYNMTYPYRYDFEADRELVKSAKEAVKKVTGKAAAVGRIATGDIFVNDPAVKDNIIKTTHPLCVEMEGAAIGQTAYMNGVPFVVIRSISDDAGESAQMSFEEYLERAAAVSAGIVLQMIK